MFPDQRMRRRRQRPIQPLLKETGVVVADLIMPLFVDESITKKVPIAAMPGQFRYPVRDLPAVASRLRDMGIRALLLFGIPLEKDEYATSSHDPEGVIPQAIRAIREAVPGMVLITDVCACEYTSHGHCGIVGESRNGPDLLNDPSLGLMNRIAVSHAAAGADIVAPSCMLDGMVGSLRRALDEEGHENVLIMSYSTKFASALFGPFREAAGSGYSFGDRTTYQMHPGNRREARMEAELDAAEGADILMVKPGGWYLDILADIRDIGLPVAAYQVSGEYSQIKAAAAKGWLDERAVVMESLLCMKRAGADLIITYFAAQVAGWFREQP